MNTKIMLSMIAIVAAIFMTVGAASSGQIFATNAKAAVSASAVGGSSTATANTALKATFNENGLPTGANWSVTYTGLEQSAIAPNSIVFNTSIIARPTKIGPNFVVENATFNGINYVPKPESGNLSYGNSITINFTAAVKTGFGKGHEKFVTSMSELHNCRTGVLDNASAVLNKFNISVSTGAIDAANAKLQADLMTYSNQPNNVGAGIKGFLNIQAVFTADFASFHAAWLGFIADASAKVFGAHLTATQMAQLSAQIKPLRHQLNNCGMQHKE